MMRDYEPDWPEDRLKDRIISGVAVLIIFGVVFGLITLADWIFKLWLK